MRYLICFFVFTLTAGNLYAGEETAATPPARHINILTYNIKMLPRILVKRTVLPGKRARLISKKLIADTLDVVVFQEAFDPSIRSLLIRKLKKEFPYRTRPGNKKAGFKFCSGVWMFSKLPIKMIDEVCFKTCDGADCMVHKGGQLCEVTMPDSSKLQIMGTHCEAGGSFEMKVGQFYQLRELMDKHYTENIPQIACGDFNCSISNRPLYDTMVTILGVQDGPISGELQFTSDHYLNDMQNAVRNPNKRNLIDHVFFRAKNTRPKFEERRVVRYTHPYHKKHEDLSDHFAVKMKLGW